LKDVYAEPSQIKFSYEIPSTDDSISPSGNQTPGFELFIFIIAFVIILGIIKYRENKKWVNMDKGKIQILILEKNPLI